MSLERLHINAFLAKAKGHLLLDVRSPGEYQHAHIPGAVSFPLFSDEERKVVGTTYKQKSREQAIKVGLDYFGPRMRKMVEEVEGMLDGRCTTYEGEDAQHRTSAIVHPTSKEVFVYCWRGGMRSGAVSWLLGLYGFKVTVLNGGYKAFRNLVLKSFEQPYHFNIIGGYTGSGKTELLKGLEKRGEKVIDLEGIACHKGSAFGSINMPPQPSQEMFENVLSLELQAASGKQGEEAGKADGSESDSPLTPPHSPIWLEDESQRIGTVNIPGALWQTMRQSPVYFLDIPFGERLLHIVEEYAVYDKEHLRGAIERISKRLGGLDTKNALLFLEEDKIADCFRILLKYYDKYYAKGLHNRENLQALLRTIPCERVTEQNTGLLLAKPTYI